MIIRLFAILFLAGSVAYMARRLRPSPFGLTLGLFVLYLPFEGRAPLSLYPMLNAVTGFSIALFLLRPGGARVRSRRAAAFQTLVLLYLALSTVGLIVSMASGGGTDEILISFKRWLDPALFGLLALNLRRDGDRQFTVACMVAGYALVALHAVREGFDYGALRRVPGLLGQPNETGAFLAMYAPLLLALALLLGLPRLRVLLISVVGIAGWGLVFLESRGALLGFAIGLLAVFLFSSRPMLAATGLMLAMAVYVLPGIVPDRVMVRFESTFTEQPKNRGATPIEEELEPSAATRITIWKASLAAMLTNPLGFGFNSFKDVIGDYAKLRRDAHNTFLLVGVELGIAGLALVITLFARIGKDAWTVARTAADPFMRALGLGTVAMVLAAVVVNCFGSRLMQLEPSTYLWILGGMMARARTPTRRQTPAAEGHVPAALSERNW